MCHHNNFCNSITGKDFTFFILCYLDTHFFHNEYPAQCQHNRTFIRKKDEVVSTYYIKCRKRYYVGYFFKHKSFFLKSVVSSLSLIVYDGEHEKTYLLPLHFSFNIGEYYFIEWMKKFTRVFLVSKHLKLSY